VKLAVIVNLYPPYIVGGNEMLAREVIEALRGRGHTVHVITGHGRNLPNDGFTHGVLDLDLDHKEDTFLGGKQPTPADILRWHLYNHKSYQATQHALRMIAPDLVVVWNLYMASMAPLIAARRAGFPLVIHTADKWLLYGLKDIAPLVWPSLKWKQGMVLLARQFLQPLLYALARPEPIITISDFIRQVYIKAGFNSAYIEALHLGVPMDLFSPDGRPQPTQGPLRFLYIGALWEGKGPQVAIQALGRLRKNPDLPPLHLDVYGQGAPSFLAYLQDVARQSGVEGQVTFHGFVERSQLATVYRTHDILLFPSMWDEPFAAVPVEAMACGMAVVATTAGGTPEAITHEQTGLLVPPNDPQALAEAAGRLVHDPQLRERFGQEAARVAREKWDFQVYVDRLEDRYREFSKNLER
jgi:glycosyltransferase involved in cell wall biosynthesis